MLSNDVGTCSWLVGELAAARIVERERLEPHLAEFTAESPYADADAFAKFLAREGILSKYQARRALDGDAKKLVLGAYVLIDVMGSGSLGPVYKALGRADQKPYALKVLPKRSWNVRLARSQVRAFQGLPAHDGVVPFIDVGTAHGLHYLAWPFVEGRTLESIVHECGPRSPGEIARIGVRVAETLKVCLSRGLIHGLIKPCNILIAADGQTKLLDYGIGALLAENPDDELVDTVSRAETLARIIECAAPECVADSSKWTPAGDLYSLGCTLYFAAAGRNPFPPATIVETIMNHQLKKPTPIRSLNSDIPPGLAEVIDRLMQKIPSDRYPKIDELIRDLAPLATVSRCEQPVPVNVETPGPGAWLAVTLPDAPRLVQEPSVVELPSEERKRGLFGRLFGSESAEETLHATIVARGAFRPGETIVLHLYIHGAGGATRLSAVAHEKQEQMRILGSGQTRRAVAIGSRVGAHVTVAGASIDQPLQEVEFTREAARCRFTLAIPEDSPSKARTGRLMIGQDGRLIAQIDFVLPVESR